MQLHSLAVTLTHLALCQQDYVVNVHGFPETRKLMTTLLDDDLHDPPTFMNIIDALKMLSEESQPGDAVFVHFSGHGGRFLDSPHDAENGGYDEAIVPCDYKQNGIIRDTLIFKTHLQDFDGAHALWGYADHFD
jgi:metacaspase-1